MEDQKSSKDQSGLNLLSCDSLDLKGTKTSKLMQLEISERRTNLVLVHPTLNPLVSQREDSAASLGVPFVGLLVVVGNRLVHSFERFWRTFDSD